MMAQLVHVVGGIGHASPVMDLLELMKSEVLDNDHMDSDWACSVG